MRWPGPVVLLALLTLCAFGGAALAQNATGHATGHAPGEHARQPMAPTEPAAHAHPPMPQNPAGPVQAGPAVAAVAAVAADAAGVSSEVVEHLGAQAALDARFQAEDGTTVRLGDLVTMPTILAPVYYSCPNECNVLLGTLASVLPQVGLRPGVDYQVLAVSFDNRDTPGTATRRKGDFLNTTAAGFPPMAWRFLSGDEPNIRKLMDSVGFGYYRVGDAFRHSIVLIAITPSGKISRYLYGIRPLAFDIAMAATEAGAEKTGLSVKRAIAMCYTYDPQGRRYVFDFMKVAGAGVLAALGVFGLFLAFGGKKRGASPGPPKGPAA